MTTHPTKDEKRMALSLHTSYGHDVKKLYFASPDGQDLTEAQYERQQSESTEYFAQNRWVKLVFAEFPPQLMANRAKYQSADSHPNLGKGLDDLMRLYDCDEDYFKHLIENQGDSPAEILAKLGVPKCQALVPRLATLQYRYRMEADKEVQRELKLEQNPRVGRAIEFTHAELRRVDYDIIRKYAKGKKMRVADVFTQLIKHLE